jgi:para-aminobenzoate synthetase component 1
MPPEPLVLELNPSPKPQHVARRLQGMPRLIWFDSGRPSGDLARYSYLTGEPFAWFEGRTDEGPNPWRILPDQLRAWRLTSNPDLPPFQGGVAGMFGYGLNRCLERLPPPRCDEFRLPDFALGLYAWVIAWDHRVDRCWIVATGFPARSETERSERAAAQIRYVLDQLERGREPIRSPELVHVERRRVCPVPSLPGISSNFHPEEFREAVGRAIDYIRAGDCFQINLAQRLVVPWRKPPLDLFCRLREVNPAPFSAYFDAGPFQIVSASPERFVRVSATGEVETRPIKGTRPRGITPEHDALLGAALLESDKDRAENVMIVDLLRNDLGRVCEYGSVRVDVLCGLETYSTVHHLVSQVRGQLRVGATALDLLRAAFPGGSVTGAPKVRAMEIIAELEPHARGPYCGCLGWIGFDGAMDTNILIRTFTAAGGWLQFPVGGGIVADSDPSREYEETLHKAAGLVRALDLS